MHSHLHCPAIHQHHILSSDVESDLHSLVRVVYCATTCRAELTWGLRFLRFPLLYLFLLSGSVPRTSCILKRQTEQTTSQYLLISYGSRDMFFNFNFFSRCIDEFHISSPKSHLCHLNQTSRLHLWLLSSHLLGHKRHSPCFWLSVIFYLGLAHRCWTWRVVLIFLSAPSSCLFILKREPSRNSIGLGQTELKFQSLSFM